MNSDELSWRTKKLGVNIIKLVESLPSTQAGKLIGDHLLRSGLYVSVNYRAASRSYSDTDFISRLGFTIEQVDESLHWMEMLVEAELVSKNKLKLLMQESNDLIAILSASAKTARENLDRRTQAGQSESKSPGIESIFPNMK